MIPPSGLFPDARKDGVHVACSPRRQHAERSLPLSHGLSDRRVIFLSDAWVVRRCDGFCASSSDLASASLSAAQHAPGSPRAVFRIAGRGGPPGDDCPQFRPLQTSCGRALSLQVPAKRAIASTASTTLRRLFPFRRSDETEGFLASLSAEKSRVSTMEGGDGYTRGVVSPLLLVIVMFFERPLGPCSVVSSA